uniref:Uncharacterized protein n=1 Tax=Anguilla anguilla TaxID=7936 RepID=A0A0E9RHP2_ANGAN
MLWIILLDDVIVPCYRNSFEIRGCDRHGIVGVISKECKKG